MTISVSYDKRKDRVVVETDGAGGFATQKMVQGDHQIRGLLKNYDVGKVEGRDTYEVKKKLNEKYREKTGTTLSYLHV